MAGLLALAAVLAANQRVALNATQGRLRERRAEIAARSAVNVALAALENANGNVATLADAWATVGDKGDAAYESGEAGSGTTFRLEILDAGSRLNVNTATEAQLQRLPLTQERIDSLLDWRETGTTARQEGAKDEYYNALPQPYNARLGSLASLDELLLIRGWTAKTLYTLPGDGVNAINSTAPPLEDEDGNRIALIDALTAESGTGNTRADGSARISLTGANINPQVLVRLGLPPSVAQAVAARAPYRSWNQLLSVPGMTPINAQALMDAVSVSAATRLEGRINVNTASESVLENALGLTPDVANAIVSRQATGLQTLGELATIPGLSVTTLAPIADLVGIGSDTWIVRAYGESGGVGVPVEATIGLRSGRMQILTYEKPGAVGLPSWWNWQAEATSVAPVDSLASALSASTVTGGSQ